MSDRLILVTNDDGINAPGILKLAKAASAFGEVYVVAPRTEKSGVSRGFTYKSSVFAAEYDMKIEGVKAFVTDGTPTDCVRIGVNSLLPRKPDLVLSGVNDGYNISSDILYSATVAAGLEAAFWGIRSVCFSKMGDESDEIVDRYLAELIEKYMDKDPGRGRTWNVNFPACSLSSLKGIMEDMKMSDDDFYKDRYQRTDHEDGRIELRLIQGRNWDVSSGTDVYAVTNGYISIGPVNCVR
ncbi:MAG: 5'/3'-nucleotidase SurE [Clostridiales bacterium]|nr:5'/3'-nucleotidase SurE [Clostridiales bacterium]